MRPVLLLCLCLAACGEAVPNGNVADVNQASAPDMVTSQAAPVRIGELGPSLDACTAAGTTRRLAPGEALPVRSAPFDTGEQVGTVASGGRFFVCSRSIDQKWLGIVYDEGFSLSPACGLSDPVPRRRAYDGPCKSGWVSAPLVKLIAGNDQVLPEANQDGPEANQAEPSHG
jgi:hypothetical protein